MRHTRTIWFLLFALLPSGCGVDEGSSAEGGEEVPVAGVTQGFDAPQGVVFTDEWVVVSNTAFQADTLSFGEGSITLISRANRTIVKTIPVSAPNPQKLLVAGDSLYVLCSGQTRFDQSIWLNIAVSPGALDRFPLDSLADATGPSESLALPISQEDPREGGFGSMAVSEDQETLLLASGQKAILWAVDLVTFSWLRGPQNPIVPFEHENNDTLTVSNGSEGTFLVSSFNRDEVFFFDEETLSPDLEKTVPMGETEDMEGLLHTLELPDGSLLGLLAIANGLFHLPNSGDKGKMVGVVGPIANHMALRGDDVFVVNSGVNNVVRFDPLSQSMESPFIAFPVGSNPWEIAISPEGSEGVVTLNHANQVAWVNLDAGELVELIQ